jgi:hypothetical protein
MTAVKRNAATTTAASRPLLRNSSNTAPSHAPSPLTEIGAEPEDVDDPLQQHRSQNHPEDRSCVREEGGPAVGRRRILLRISRTASSNPSRILWKKEWGDPRLPYAGAAIRSKSVLISVI